MAALALEQLLQLLPRPVSEILTLQQLVNQIRQKPVTERVCP